MQIFKTGKLTFIMDAQAGSSGKARTASYVAARYGGKDRNVTFACNTFSSNAAHWTRLRDGRKFLYKALNSMAYDHERYEKFYIGPGAAIETQDVLKEIEENSLPAHKLGIHPLTVVVQEMDAGYEKGVLGFDGEELLTKHDGTMKTGSTCSGVGAASARRALRRPTTLYAKDVPALKPFVCDVSNQIIARLEHGESGFQEIAQGYQLSLMHSYFAPYTTYRNVTVAQALSDMMLPTKYAGPVILNLRTYPIRINSNKYIGTDGTHITQADIEAGVPHTVYKGNSGPWYPDQTELTWDEVTRMAGAPHSLAEITSKTKLARRVATFSRLNVAEAIRDNDTGEGVVLALNFADYVDYTMAGQTSPGKMTTKFVSWIKENLGDHSKRLALIGTGANTEDTIDLGMLETARAAYDAQGNAYEPCEAIQ